MHLHLHLFHNPPPVHDSRGGACLTYVLQWGYNKRGPSPAPQKPLSGSPQGESELRHNGIAHWGWTPFPWEKWGWELWGCYSPISTMEVMRLAVAVIPNLIISTNTFLAIILLQVTPSANRNSYRVAIFVGALPRVAGCARNPGLWNRNSVRVAIS